GEAAVGWAGGAPAGGVDQARDARGRDRSRRQPRRARDLEGVTPFPDERRSSATAPAGAGRSRSQTRTKRPGWTVLLQSLEHPSRRGRGSGRPGRTATQETPAPPVAPRPEEAP